MRHSEGPRDAASAATRLTLINLNVNRICRRPRMTIERSFLARVRATCSYNLGEGTRISQMKQSALMWQSQRVKCSLNSVGHYLASCYAQVGVGF